jgi:hypothetical protein
MKSRRDFLKLAAASSFAAFSPEILLGNSSLLSSNGKKAVAEIWQMEKLRSNVAKALGERLDINLLKTIGTWSATNRKAVLNEVVKLYDIDLSYTESGKLPLSTEQIAALEDGEFASSAQKNRYEALLKEGSKSKKDALLVVVKLTVDEIEKIKSSLKLFSPTDKITENLTYLADGAMGHYWAIDRELIKLGVVKGCCEAGDNYCKSPLQYPITYGRDHIANPKALNNEQRHALAHMWSEEKMAHDAFETVYSVYPHLRLFYNIGHWSEVQHMSAVEELVALYNIDVNDYANENSHYDPSKLRKMGPGDYAIEDFETRYQNVLLPYAVQSDIAALKLGCMVEVQDIRDLKGFLSQNFNNPYIERTFKYLIAGSQSHYWAYHYALIAKGVKEGCCSAGADYCKDASEYPSGSHREDFALLWNRSNKCFG